MAQLHRRRVGTRTGEHGERGRVQQRTGPRWGLISGNVDDDQLVQRAEELAEVFLEEAIRGRGRREHTQGRRITRLLDDPAGLSWTLALTDEVLRIRDRRRAGRHFASLVASEPARFLGPVDRALLRVGGRLAGRLPALVMPLVRRRVDAELAGFVVAAEERPFARHLARRRSEGIRLNINLLGEAVLGDAEANVRLESILALLRRPDVDYVSVKVSSICAQLNMAAFDAEVDRVAAQLRPLYDEALRHRPSKMVNLDMEEYRDLDLTVAVFERVLSEKRYASLNAGIVLQAYLPDSVPALRQLGAWARTRHRDHGGAIKLRIVKGANLAMESVEAELGGWVQAPFASKAEVDANFKRMLDIVVDPANSGAIRVGVASHNLFEVAWALTLSEHRGLRDMLEIEMLEGMAPSIAAAVRRRAGGLLLYAPVARRADRESTIAYLVRRFDENTGPDNFLRHQFSLRPATPAWEAERTRFQTSVADRSGPDPPTRRGGDSRALAATAPTARSQERFVNEPDTDVAVAANRQWLAAQMRPWGELGVDLIPAVIAGRTLTTELPLTDGHDPSAPDDAGYRWAACTEAVIDDAVGASSDAGRRWRALGATDRRDVLAAVARGLGLERGRLIGVMARDGGKTFAEADPEVSEAIDFARYYGDCGLELDERQRRGTRFEPYGTVVVVPPWNFPLAIPAGGTFAALAAGNAVILKPAPETVATAWTLAEVCWRAGVPRDLLQFAPCVDGDASRRLVTHEDVGAVILTGAWDTARMFLGWRPTLRLHAETSGKNAIVITSAADLDQAVADLVRSAFGHAGQKCSAASLAIVEASVYDDPRFRQQLADAVQTLRPGPGWDLRTTIGPLIRPPSGPLDDALRRLGPGESWLVAPRQIGDNPQRWAPGVKLGVEPGSPFHLTECFGPVLGLMRAVDLEQAIDWQNQPAYGLTAGLQSLDPDEISRWRDAAQAGNLYVNRHTTGAIVRRQPFGGWKRSVVGPGAKAGGPNYVASLGTWTAEWPGNQADFAAATARAWAEQLGPSDPIGLEAEANVLRYRALRLVMLRAGEEATDGEVAMAVTAAEAVGAVAILSSPSARVGFPTATVETDGSLIARLRSGHVGGAGGVDKLRLLGVGSHELRLAAYDAGVWLDDTAVIGDPRQELLRWVREQAVSETLHRHGDITGRRPGPFLERFDRLHGLGQQQTAL